jgi:hypothetical protein
VERGTSGMKKKKEESSGLFSSTTIHEKGGRKLKEENKQRAVERIEYGEQGVSLSESEEVRRKKLEDAERRNSVSLKK